MIVEDEPRLREMLVTAVSEMGFSACGVKSAEEALRSLQESAVDIAVLDLNLPGMGGMELFEQMHTRWPDTRVIILTGYGDLDAAKHAIHLDVIDFLTKPTSLRDLEIALDRAHQRTSPDQTETAGASLPTIAGSADAAAGEATTLQDSEREHIIASLKRNGGNRAATAAELGISVRTLYYRLAEYQQQGYLN